MDELRKTEMTKPISIRFDASLFEEVKKIGEVYSISIAEFIRDSVKKEVDFIKNDFFYKLSQLEYCSDEESKEIIEELNKMNEDDLKIVKKEVIEI
jgi:hypothetical protein